MPYLPARPNLDQLRHQAKDLLRAAQGADPSALARMPGRVILASAQLAIAREYGFSSWRALKLEVDRREVLNSRDSLRLARLLAEHPSVATTKMSGWCDHKKGADVLGYMAMLRFDSARLGLTGDLPGTGLMARALIAAGAPVDGHPGDAETPLITAASYGDLEVAKVLIEAGADIEAVSAPDSGGVPGGTALQHAAVFSMTEVVDLLAGKGARISSLEMAAAAGDLSGFPPARFPLQNRLRALVFAADHERLDVIDQLVAAGTPVNQADATWKRMPLHIAAGSDRAGSVRRLLAHGADPNLRDPQRHRTPLEWSPGTGEVEAILRPLTRA